MDPNKFSFWNDILKDHALFIYLLLDERKVPQLKADVGNLYDEWNTNTLQSREQFANYLNRLATAKQQLITLLNQGAVINSILPPHDFKALVLHMIKEFNFALRDLDNQVNPQEEVGFWKEESAEHDELASHSIINNPQIQTQVMMLAQALKTAPNQTQKVLSLIKESNQGAMMLDQMIRNGQVQSIMNLAMLEHEMKEGQEAERRLQQLV